MKLISISLSPNVFAQDIEHAKTMLDHPSLWIEGKDIAAFENALTSYFENSTSAAHSSAQGGLVFGSRTSKIYTFNSGRSALLSILQAFNIGKGDEILLQAFTCNAVPNPVLWAGAIPRYVDISEDTYNMDVQDLEKNITPKCKAIIVQHTFGLSADMDAILPIARKYKLIVIEDCAHALGATYKGKKVGTFGDAAFFSFGRDKVISSVYGGAAIVGFRVQGSGFRSAFERLYSTLAYPSEDWVKQQLRHPICISALLQWYNTPFTNYGIGKFLLQVSQASRYLSKAVHWKEKRGLKPDYFPARMPNALAYLALKQFKRLDQFNAHRRKLAIFYYKELKILNPKHYRLNPDSIYLRYPVRHPKATEIIRKARRQGILLGDWYNSPVAPDDTQLDKMLYKKGSCPVAEKLSRETFNLPTNPNLPLEDAKRIVEFLKNYEA